ncbi:MAG TPA: helix-turn-helix domain-containing protein [Dehalococcoidia bacterium]|nr:helix-turn-helix domain-containing protein [Dehalococcoidia bacterium]
MTCDSRFEAKALQVASRAAALFSARVAVLDASGSRVADEPPPAVHSGSAAVPPRPLRVPLVVDGQRGEVVIEPSSPGSALAPELAQAVVAMIADLTGPAPPQDRQAQIDRALAHLAGLEPADEQELVAAAQSAGIDPVRRYGVILLCPCSPDQPAAALLPALLRSVEEPDGTVCGRLSDRVVVVLRRSAGGEPRDRSGRTELPGLERFALALVERLATRETIAAAAGVGRPFPELRGIARAYLHARFALELGRRLRPNAPVHTLAGLGAAALVGVTDPQTRAELADHLLAPLAGAHELRDTLAAFFAEDCSPTATVQRLFIHRNTLSYRLDKIAALTGLDPRRFEDAVTLRVALLLRHELDADGPLVNSTNHQW